MSLKQKVLELDIVMQNQRYILWSLLFMRTIIRNELKRGKCIDNIFARDSLALSMCTTQKVKR